MIKIELFVYADFINTGSIKGHDMQLKWWLRCSVNGVRVKLKCGSAAVSMSSTSHSTKQQDTCHG